MNNISNKMQSKPVLLLLILFFTLNVLQVNGQDNLVDSNPCGIGMHQEQTSDGQLICVDDIIVDSQNTYENPLLWIIVGVILLIILVGYIRKKSQHESI